MTRRSGKKARMNGELPGEYLKRSLVAVSTHALTEGGRIKDEHYIVKTTRLDGQWRVEVEHNGQATVLPHKVVEQIIRHRMAIQTQQRRDSARETAQLLISRARQGGE